MKQILLFNRYGIKNYLEEVENKKYLLKFENEEADMCTRIGYKDKNYTNVEFVDPSGGPFMEVGVFTVEDMLLNKIKETNDGFMFIFK